MSSYFSEDENRNNDNNNLSISDKSFFEKVEV